MVFDNDPDIIGMQINDIVVRDVNQLVDEIRAAGIKVAMIAVPAPQAQDVANQLIKAGVQAILNYAPISLNVPQGIHVQQIDPSIDLQRMTYYLE
jgi:redox-sensing transcriptional repressor